MKIHNNWTPCLDFLRSKTK